MRRTKIVATIGPSSRDPRVLRELIRAGMDVARLNFSHGTHEDHARTYREIRGAADAEGRSVGILADLQGPKIRIGKVRAGGVRLVQGAALTLTTRPVEGDEGTISTDYEALPRDVAAGDSIFIADGTILLRVIDVAGDDVRCDVVHGGTLTSHKGINLPGVKVSAPSLTEKDIDDLAFAQSLGVDFVALSFVRTAADVLGLRQRIGEPNGGPSIVSKIERPEALADIDAIIAASDAIMLARGDLGVEVPLTEVPQIQKRLIAKCNDLGVPVITATQMLESMTSSPRPTRAEVTDVANAIYDGTDAVMLSGETASGEFPVEAVTTMAGIADRADEAIGAQPTYDRIVRMRQSGVRKGKAAFGDAIGQATCRIAEVAEAKRIVCFTTLGYTANLIARYRPSVPITAITLSEGTRRRCSLIWGVDAVLSIEPAETDRIGQLVDEVLLARGLAGPGDTVVIAAGMPLAHRTRANMIKLHTIGGRTDDA